MPQEKRPLSTTQLLAAIRRSRDFSQVNDLISDLPGNTEFCHFLYETMNSRGLNAKTVIERTEIERSYFYHILSGQKTPSRNMVLRICLAIGATLSETNQSLRLASQGSLYPKIRRDAAIIFCIEHNYGMRRANEFLIELGELPLFKEE